MATLSGGKEAAIDPPKSLSGRNILGFSMYHLGLLPTLLESLVSDQDKLPSHKVVSHKFPLAEVNEAFAQAEWDQRHTQITRAMLVP